MIIESDIQFVPNEWINHKLIWCVHWIHLIRWNFIWIIIWYNLLYFVRLKEISSLICDYFFFFEILFMYYYYWVRNGVHWFYVIKIFCFLSFSFFLSLMPLNWLHWIKCIVLYNNGKVTHPFAVIYYRGHEMSTIGRTTLLHLSWSKWSIWIGFVWSFKFFINKCRLTESHMKWSEFRLAK